MDIIAGVNRPLLTLSPNRNVTLGLKVSWRFHVGNFEAVIAPCPLAGAAITRPKPRVVRLQRRA
jgi:hypothetical protein